MLAPATVTPVLPVGAGGGQQYYTGQKQNKQQTGGFAALFVWMKAVVGLSDLWIRWLIAEKQEIDGIDATLSLM